MIAPGTNVEETSQLHNRDDVVYVKPVGCDWETGIQVLCQFTGMSGEVPERCHCLLRQYASLYLT